MLLSNLVIISEAFYLAVRELQSFKMNNLPQMYPRLYRNCHWSNSITSETVCTPASHPLTLSYHLHNPYLRCIWQYSTTEVSESRTVYHTRFSKLKIKCFLKYPIFKTFSARKYVELYFSIIKIDIFCPRCICNKMKNWWRHHCNKNVGFWILEIANL